VLDNSVAMCWLLNDGRPGDAAYALKVLASLKHTQAIVPGLWALEAANVVAKAEAKGLVTEARTQAFVATLARRYKLSAYDATYLELALRAGLPLASLDADLAKAARRAGVPVFQPK